MSPTAPPGDIVEQARQHVRSFEAIGGTGGYPFSVRLAQRVLSLQTEIESLRRSNGEENGSSAAVMGPEDFAALMARAHSALSSHFLNQTIDGHSVRRLIEDMGAALCRRPAPEVTPNPPLRDELVEALREHVIEGYDDHGSRMERCLHCDGAWRRGSDERHELVNGTKCLAALTSSSGSPTRGEKADAKGASPDEVTSERAAALGANALTGKVCTLTNGTPAARDTDARNKALEEAAVLADEKAAWCLSQRSGCKEGVDAWNRWTSLMVQAMSLAESIRALKSPEPKA